MLFKRNMLAVAVLAMTSGVVFANGNESVINQINGDTNSAQVDQNTVTDQGQFSQVLQNEASASTVRVYQGTTSDVGVLDATAPVGIANLPDPTTFAPTYAYTVLGANPDFANYASVLQDTTTNSTASIFQLDGGVDDVSAFSDLFDLANGGTMGFDGTGGVTVDLGTFNASYTPAGAGNANNVGLIYQGAVPADRDGTALGDATVNSGADSEVALIIQTGTNHVAQIYQAGDNQTAGIFQDFDHNDGYIAQYTVGGVGDTNTAAIVQLGSNGFSTIYQSGSNNVAFNYQHAE
jgi:hypothetical protein